MTVRKSRRSQTRTLERWFALAAFALAAVTAIAPAEAAPPRLQVDLAEEGGKVTAKGVLGVDLKSVVNITAEGATFAVGLRSLDPAKVAVTVGGAALTPAASKPNEVTYQLAPPKGGEASLVVSYNGTAVATVQLAALSDDGAQAPPSSPGTTSSIKDLLKTPCPTQVDLPAPRKDTVNMLVTPLGNVIAIDSPEGIDENDTIVVTVLADAALLPYLRVVRTSDLRLGGGINILGADVQVPTEFTHKGAKGAKASACGTLQAMLRDFAPGRGTIAINLQTGSDQVTLGTIELAIHPLYTGMFSLGGAWGRVVDQEFDVASNGTNSVVTTTNTGDRQFSYVLLYTPFVWGPRDIQRSASFIDHLNPSVGFSLSSPLDNVFAGASIDLLNSVVFTLGMQVSHVARLDPNSGLTPGSPFTGSRDDLPISKEWKTGLFWAVSVDLRAAVQLVRTVLGTAAATH